MVSISSYGVGKELMVQCTAVLLRMCRNCTLVYEIGERTKTVPNKPHIILNLLVTF